MMVKSLEPYSTAATSNGAAAANGSSANGNSFKTGGPGHMYVLKRDGRREAVHFDKITSRINKLCYGLNMDFIDPPAITFKVKRP